MKATRHRLREARFLQLLISTCPLRMDNLPKAHNQSTDPISGKIPAKFRLSVALAPQNRSETNIYFAIVR